MSDNIYIKDVRFKSKANACMGKSRYFKELKGCAIYYIEKDEQILIQAVGKGGRLVRGGFTFSLTDWPVVVAAVQELIEGE